MKLPSKIEIIGIDPGLVHTGLVHMVLDVEEGSLSSTEVLFDGMPEEEIAGYVRGLSPMAHIYMEAYRTRSAWNSDPEMQAGIARIKKAAPRVEIVTNMGVKKVVTNELMKLLGVYTFTQKSHHQDLRSAARIGLMGALKVEPFNRALYKIATKKLEGGAA